MLVMSHKDSSLTSINSSLESVHDEAIILQGRNKGLGETALGCSQGL